jgi:hypothetical protein
MENHQRFIVGDLFVETSVKSERPEESTDDLESSIEIEQTLSLEDIQVLSVKEITTEKITPSNVTLVTEKTRYKRRKMSELERLQQWNMSDKSKEEKKSQHKAKKPKQSTTISETHGYELRKKVKPLLHTVALK